MNPGNLPTEIWSKIFDKVEDAQDWLNLRRASPSFEGLVEDKVTEKLFPAVLPHIFEHMRKTATLGEMLELRLVCRNWGQAVDGVLPIKEKRWIEKHFEFRGLHKMSAFLQKFNETHSRRSPFIGNHVGIQFPSSFHDLAEFGNLVTRFLEKFGPHIKSLRVIDFPKNISRDLADRVRRYRAVVQGIPNLESLTIVSMGVGRGHYLADNHDGADEVALRNEDLLPLQTVSKLKSLAFSGNWARVEELQNAMLSMYGKGNVGSLKKLKMMGLPAESKKFTLESATILYRPNKEDIYSGLSNCGWPLAHLTLHIWGLCSNSFAIQKAFESAQHFRDTLTSLEIRGGNGDTTGLDRFRANLPHLESLTLPIIIPFSVMENLEELRRICFRYVLIPGHDDEARPEDLVHSLETNITTSGIWNMRSKLRNIYLTNEYDDDDEGKGERILKSYSRDLFAN